MAEVPLSIDGISILVEVVLKIVNNGMEHFFILVLEERDLPNYLKFPNLLRVLIGEHLLLEKMVELRVIRGQHSEPVIGELSDSVIHPRYNRRLPCTFVKQRNFTEVMRWRYKLNI